MRYPTLKLDSDNMLQVQAKRAERMGSVECCGLLSLLAVAVVVMSSVGV